MKFILVNAHDGPRFARSLCTHETHTHNAHASVNKFSQTFNEPTDFIMSRQRTLRMYLPNFHILFEHKKTR